jgi:phenylalanyl-tRNA synthetase beta chain
MRAPLSWLADYVENLPPVDELAARLTMVGLEVEAVHRPDRALADNLVIARIEKQTRHPDADRLSLCVVDTGTGTRQIVCGASNMKQGDTVVLATPGAVLPGGVTIKKAKIRGQESQGMLCSAAELGLVDDVEGIIVLGDGEASPGESAAPLLGLDETVLEIAVTPNRGDCLSMRGLAREIAAACALRSRPAIDERPRPPSGQSRFRVRVSAPEACPLYHGLELSDVRIGESPRWLRARLIAAGLRPINNVVDVTNYVLLDRGQPLHAFDAALLAGETIEVAVVASESEIETLDAQPRRLVPGDLVIRDERGPIALAGVMGGLRTAVSEKTRALFLESPIVRPGSVRATSRRLGLVSESSMRFERGVDPAGVDAALLDAARMIVELCGARIVGGIATGGAGVADRAPVRLRPRRVAQVLGVDVERAEIESILGRLGGVVERTGDDLSVRAPSHRHDLEREIDWIEEIARLHGYDRIPEAVPVCAMAPAVAPPTRPFEANVRGRLAALGLTEVIGLSFCSTERNEMFPGLHAGPGRVVLRNPLRPEAAEMRRSILTTLVDAHVVNVRGGARVTDLFSIGRTFAGDGELEVVGGVLWGPRRARGPGDDGGAELWDLKGAVEKIVAIVADRDALAWAPCVDRCEYHPRVSAAVLLAGVPVGYVGTIHPDVAERLGISRDLCVFEIDTRQLVSYAPAPGTLKPVPRHPASARDVSLLVPDRLFAGDVIGAARSLGEPLIEHVSVFDEYVGEGIPAGHRALAFSFVYRAADRTLTEGEVAQLHDRVVADLCKHLGIRPRFE